MRSETIHEKTKFRKVPVTINPNVVVLVVRNELSAAIDLLTGSINTKNKLEFRIDRKKSFTLPENSLYFRNLNSLENKPHTHMQPQK